MPRTQGRRPRLMFAAGETSGDHHAAAVIRALGTRADCFGLGGPAMAAAGMRLDLDLAGRSVLGFVEVLRHLRFFAQALGRAQDLVRRERPDLLVLVDNPGFNLRLAKRVRDLGVPMVYYVSPQVWAWKRGRVRTMAGLLREMLVVFPFEKPIYDAAGLPCRALGHPLLDAIPRTLLGLGAAGAQRRLSLRRGLPWRGPRPVVGLLPGSREQEVRGLLGVMLAASERAVAQGAGPRPRFVVVQPATAPAAWYEGVAQARSRGLDVQIYRGSDPAKAYAVRAGFDAALVASGTATLETALLGTPFLILYRVHPLTYAIGRRLVRVHSIGLANIVAGRRVVPEFLQHELEPGAVAAALRTLLDDPAACRAQRLGLEPGLRALGRPGVAGRVAERLLALAGEARAR